MSQETASENPLDADTESLRKLVTALSKERDDLAGELKETRGEARDRRHEAKGLAAQVEALTKERDTFRATAETTAGDWQTKIDALSGTIRGLKHERAFAKVAGTLKVSDPTKQADLVKLAGYAPEGDEPDEARITASFQEALKGRAWLVDAPPAPGGATNAPGGAGATQAQSGGKPGPGADRGQSTQSESRSQPEGRVPGRL
jgi:hypothetical protein